MPEKKKKKKKSNKENKQYTKQTNSRLFTYMIFTYSYVNPQAEPSTCKTIPTVTSSTQ